MRIDFISDVACPWCAIGLASLEQALAALGPEAEDIELHFQPFELNPDMPPERADAAAYLKAKYGMGDEQRAARRAHIAACGAALGLVFGPRAHVWNASEAHRLLHCAGLQGPAAQRAMKRALLQAYHGEGRNPATRAVLLETAAAAAADGAQAGGGRRSHGCTTAAMTAMDAAAQATRLVAEIAADHG